jgi:hypothetical protein
MIKHPAFYLGLLLLLASGVAIGWMLFQTKPFTISTIECYRESQSCSATVTEDLNQTLLGKSLLITDFDLVLPNRTYQVTAFRKYLPGKLMVEVSPADYLTDINLAFQTDEELITHINERLAQAQLSVQNSIIKRDIGVVIVQLEKEQALLTVDQAEQDINKVVLIKKHLQLAEIDTAIIEIDARYQMPVLRTTKTNF